MIGPYLGDMIGYKKLLSLLLPVMVAIWTLLAYTPYLSILYSARVFSGFFFGMIMTLVPPLIAETSEPKIRGFALVIPEILVGVGTLLGYTQAHFLDWRTATITQIVPFIPTLIILPFLLEVSSNSYLVFNYSLTYLT